ncbi:MAG: nickel-dependent hydrogenase large subunit [Candidatus Aminicenantes bacterium]|nr:nickel-dependent hydrogenase large subunit [Candidatus Aminicenantes bacterium]
MKTISIDHLTRVEGTGGISATIDGKVVTDVKFMIYEGPRLVERLTVGRSPEEDVSLIPRICAICSVSHKLAAIRAMENSLSIEVSPKVTFLRELMHMGEMIESHSLHIYYLALPDYLGFPNAIAMASDYEFEVKIALEMKEFGNHIMKTLTGRYIHGENPQIGGFGRFPSKEELLWIKSRAIQFMPFVHKTVSLFCEIDYPDCPEDKTLYVCCDPGDGGYGFLGDQILLSNGESFQRDDYKALTNEFVVSHSNAKRSRYNGKPYSVGALARINILGNRLGGEAGKSYKKYFNERWTKNPLFHNAAQALEICYSFERIPLLIDAILNRSNNPRIVKYTAKKGNGTGLVEAPRGLLIHHYEISGGLVAHADIITPTAQNADDIERYCQIAAQKLLDEGKEDMIARRMEQVVRAFDPCISCSAHTATVKQAPKDNWKIRLDALLQKDSPVYIGLGRRDLSDDAAGIELALRLEKSGNKTVFIEPEVGEFGSFQNVSPKRPLLFIDAVDFQEKPGKITVFPLSYVLNNALLSHKFLPFVTAQSNPQQLKHSYILGIQPKTIARGSSISPSVQKAIERVLKHLEI